VRTIGLLGGMSWESSIEYYRFVNERARDRLGGLPSRSEAIAHSDSPRREPGADRARGV
jgi:aspartate/glutamate racemase